MKIFVLCRQNQARSIVISAFLQHHLPEITIYSAGVAAVENSPIPHSIVALCDTWGLEITDFHSTPWEKVQVDVKVDDIVICADEQVYQIALATISSEQLINLADKNSRDFLIPTDPAGASREVVEQELAKCLLQTQRLLSSHVEGLSQMITHAYIPRSEEKFDEAIAFMRKNIAVSKSKNFIILDCNLRAPKPEIWAHSSDMQAFDEGLTFGRVKSGMVLHAAHEFTLWQKTLLSTPWKRFLSTLNQSYTVNVITPPLCVEGKLSLETLLAILYAESLTVV
jgi:protein-tyrosine-phosphatase